jgi:energy-coupling factor transport system permease protein
MNHNIVSFYEQDSLLHRLNPTVKLGIAFFFMIVATLLFDVRTLGLIFLLAVGVTWRLGRIPLTALLRGMGPFLILGLGYLWMNALFPRAEGEAVTVLFRFGPFRVVEEGLLTGLALTARALCFGACSLFFITTTDPTDFIISLIQQLGLAPRLAYGTLAAYRFVPLLEAELAQIRAAHRLRGVGEGEGLRGKVIQLYRYTLPLLASAIRKAGRVAIAMESRAFTGDRGRTYYREVRVTRTDWLFAANSLISLTLILVIGWQLNWLRFWQGGLGF